jgi:hypothetical protein
VLASERLTREKTCPKPLILGASLLLFIHVGIQEILDAL